MMPGSCAIPEEREASYGGAHRLRTARRLQQAPSSCSSPRHLGTQLPSLRETYPWSLGTPGTTDPVGNIWGTRDTRWGERAFRRPGAFDHFGLTNGAPPSNLQKAPPPAKETLAQRDTNWLDEHSSMGRSLDEAISTEAYSVLSIIGKDLMKISFHMKAKFTNKDNR